ncbi:MAG: hypothetical protein IPK55_11305 [Streptococcus sp.]|nr:hypothetical protein [Streptococcus sp.]
MKQYLVNDFDEITSITVSPSTQSGFLDIDLTGRIIKHGKEGNALEPIMHRLAKQAVSDTVVKT